MNVQDRLRLANVSRWHIVNTAKHQSVAEHSFNVAIIALELHSRLPAMLVAGINRGDLAVYALHHDMEEVWTGDIPSVAKPRKQWNGTLDQTALVKIADVIEGLWFIEEYRVDRHGKQVAADLHRVLNALISSFNDHKTRAAIDGLAHDVMYGRFKLREDD